MEEFVANPSRWKIGLFTMLALGFVAIGSMMVRDPDAQAEGWFVVGFFGLCSAVLLRRLADSREQLRIGTTGIRWVQWSEATIPWSEITDVTTWTYKRQTSIVLKLRNPDSYPSSRAILRWLAAPNRSLSGGDVAISLMGTDQSTEAALSAIGYFRQNRLSGST